MYISSYAMKKLGAFAIFSFFASGVPLATQAQTAQTGTSVQTLLFTIGEILDLILPVVLALGVIAFLWGVVKYMTAGADEERRSAARSLMIYGIIGLFVMVSIWGLVGVIGKTFNIGSGGVAPIPQVPLQSRAPNAPATR